MSKEWTGERLETFILNENTTEHLHRYAIASTICRNMDVLDIASGEGYGSNLLSIISNKVIGVDISKQAVEESSKKYTNPNLIFKVGSASEIPLPTNSIDVAVSFETIEHHDQHNEMIKELKRVLKPNGILIMSSPDKKFYTDIRKYHNPYHVKELYFDEFKELIKNSFKCSNFLFQKIVSGSLIIPEKTSTGFNEYTGNYENIQINKCFSPLYNLCIASDNEIPNIPSSFFDGTYLNELSKNSQINDAISNAIKDYQNGWRYRIGNFLLSPFKIFKRA